MPFLTRRLIQNFKQTSILQNISSAYPSTRVKRIPQTVQVNDQEIKISRHTAFLRNVLENDLNFVKLLREQKNFSTNDWLNARDELLKISIVNEKNIDAIISNLCFGFENIDAFMSYMKYLKSNNYEINLYLKGTYASKLALKQILTKSDMQEIYDIYDSLLKQYSVLDGTTCDRLIQALCVTERWEESAKLFEMLTISTKKPSKAISRIVKAAFDNNKPETGWKYFIQAAESEIHLLAQAFASYLEYCLRIFKDKGLLEKNLLKMFEICRDKEVLINKEELDNYLTIFQSLGYTYFDTFMNIDGECMHCSHQLPKVVITQEQFNELSELFMKNVVVGDNLYTNTTPIEFKKFLQFLKNALPYDIVIDGLNVALSQQNKTIPAKVEILSKAIEYFVNRNQKVILLGRKHMLKWNNMGYIKHNTKMFLFDNSSFDDPHLIYATFYGGLNTCFLSGDLMRQHKSLLPKNMQKLFKLWQLSHQYLKNQTNAINYPVKFESIPHEDKNGWHMPYFTGNSSVPKDSYNATSNWICLRKKCQ